jgi:hypothetical protein
LRHGEFFFQSDNAFLTIAMLICALFQRENKKMNFGNLSKTFATLALTATFGIGTAHAGLTGDVISVDRAFPTPDVVQNHEGSFTVGEDAGYVDGYGYYLLASDNSITILGNYSVNWTESSFSGIVVSDLTKAFDSTWTLASNNLIGFDSSDITLSGNKLTINWEGLNTLPGTEIKINFGAVSPVPEPATYAMLLAGLTLLGFTARRRSV